MNAPQRVMVVDDDEGVRTSWKRLLTEQGFDVTTAEDGVRAISRLQEAPAQVVVSDLRMPGLDGLELLDWIHQRRPNTRFILFTGYGNEDVERKARKLGAFGYLNKPVSPEMLSAMIAAAMQTQVVTGAKEPAATTQVIADVSTQVSTDLGLAVEPATGKRLSGALQVAGGLIAAPLLGLAFVIFLPLIGIGAFFWVVGQAIWGRVGATKT